MTVTAVVGIAVFLAGLDVALYVLGSRSTGQAGPDAALAYRLVFDVAVLAMVRWPAAVAAFVTAGTVVLQLAEVVSPGLLVASPVLSGDPLTLPATATVVFTVVRLRNTTFVWLLVAALTLLATRPWDPSWVTVPLGLLNTLLPAVAARYIDARAKLLDGLREKAGRAAEEARAQERTRLAAELHDVVTHRVSLMVLQAGALEVTTAEPATKEAAATLRGAGMQALDELRELVGVFGGQRDGASPAVGPPQPHVDLAELVDASAAAGVAVELVRVGDDADVPAAVARAAHRVVQEALTNVHKHAPGGEVRVDVRYTGECVEVTIENGPSAADPGLAASGSGAGLQGLRGRVEMLGGELQAGPRPDGGFRVCALLPVTS
jgi:signal transduction histidine kinase